MVAQAIKTRLSRINAMMPSSPAAIGCWWILVTILLLPLDGPILRLFHPYARSVHENVWALDIMRMGHLLFVAVVCAAVFVVHPLRWRGASLICVSAVLAKLFYGIAKPVLARPLPSTSIAPFDLPGLNVVTHRLSHFYEYLLPSGYTSVSFATAAAMSFLLPRGRLFFFALAAMVGFERIAELAHYPSEVVLNAGLGVLAFYLTRRLHESFDAFSPANHKRPLHRQWLVPVFERAAKPFTHRAVEAICRHDEVRRIMALADGADYAARHMQGALATPEKDTVLLEGLKLAPRDGLVMEFGVWRGSTINLIADTLGGHVTVHGFDSFEGLPEDWFGKYAKGSFHMEGGLPQVRSNVKLYKGWFDRTLPKFAAEHPDTPIAFLHVDCDLYSSTKTIFDHLGDRLEPGSVIVFDEYFNYPGWREHEFKAFQELVARRGLAYQYIAYNNREWNVAVQIIERSYSLHRHGPDSGGGDLG